MANYTPNYNLKKPAQEDFFDVDDFNGNADLIDTALNNKADKNLSNVTGTLAITKGGTGATTAANALSNLGVTAALNNKADKDLSNVTGTLPISKGGTGATTASNALSNLGVTTALNNKADKDLSNVTGTLAIANGGTGATTAANALSNLGVTTALNNKADKNLNNVTGTLAIANGGTGATTAANALSNLGVTTALSNKADKDLSNVTGTLAIANGGTGATTASGALSNLGAFSSSGGTIAGDVKLKTSSNYGCALTFGDGTNVQIKEPTNNTMEINANKINLAITSGIQYLTVSSSITSGVTTNQKTVFDSDGTITDACRKVYVQETQPDNAPNGSLWAW